MTDSIFVDRRIQCGLFDHPFSFEKDKNVRQFEG